MSRLISLFDVTPMLDSLAAGQLILTPNQRLASRIRAAYAIYCREQGQQVVVAPAVYSFNTWVADHWQRLLLNAYEGVMDCRLLSVAEEQVVWEKIVERSLLASPLLRPAATAQQAISAFCTMVQWQQDFSAAVLRTQFESNEDCRVFLSWADEFEQLCKQRQWLPGCRQPERLIQAFEQGALKPVECIVGVGFDDIAPLHQSLIHLAGRFEAVELGTIAEHINIVSCESDKQALFSSAVWAKKVLRDDPHATVAIVVPELTSQRQTVQRILQEVFEPDFNRPGQARRNLPFNFSAGYPLLQAPVIEAAMTVLSLCQGDIPLSVASALCQSPFYCLDKSDSNAVTDLLTLLYQHREHTVSMVQLRQMAVTVSEHRVQSDCPAQSTWLFARALQQQANYMRAISMTKPRTPTQWIPIIQQLLEIIGWPGTRILDSIEYQQVNQWQQQLEQFSSLDAVVEPISFAAAARYVNGLLSRHIFQPQSADTSLQVLGTLEAAGLQFSHIWLHSMSAQQWPPPASPNPLLPFQLQREQQMPQATAERELAYATQLTRRFLHSAQTVIASYPQMIDENPARASALFSRYEQKTLTQVLGRELNTLLPVVEMRRRHIASASLHDYDPGDAPPLVDGENISGGSQLFASQSACPFKAFSVHRLQLRALPCAVLGLDSADRGTLLHRALELAWEALKSQQQLHKHSEATLQKLCADIADYALTELNQRRAVRLGARYSQLESKRLQHLLFVWLQIEKQRAPFAVENTELRSTVKFSTLTVDTRIDRVDRLSDGSLLIIDYKTGKSSINRWWGERPDEPQLPLYSVLTDSTLHSQTQQQNTDNNQRAVAAIAFAQIRIDGCGLKGVGSEQLPEPMLQWQDKIKTDAGVESWVQLKHYWQKVLRVLAEDFIAGKSAVDPKQLPQTCQYCDLASVCRINHHD